MVRKEERPIRACRIFLKRDIPMVIVSQLLFRNRLAFLGLTLPQTAPAKDEKVPIQAKKGPKKDLNSLK